MSIEKNKEELKERLLNARALSDDELAQVTGGTVYDAKCSNCGEVIGGAGNECFTEWMADRKVSNYNQDGCPFCGQKNTMYKVSWSSFDEMIGW